MSISIDGVNNSYVSGDMVCCNVRLNIPSRMGCFVNKSMECKIYLIKRTIITSHSGTSVYKKNSIPKSCNKFVRDVIISSLTIDDICKNKSNDVKFRIPTDSQSSSIVNMGGESTRRILYGILAKVNNSNNMVIEKFQEFHNDFPLPFGTPMYFSSVLRDDNHLDKRISLMYDSNTSSFTPGEIVELNVSIVNKTSFRITSVKVSISHVDSNVSVSCKKYAINTVPYDPLIANYEEYSTMRNDYSSNLFSMKMCKSPNNVKGDRIVTLKFLVSFGFHSTWSLVDTVNVE